MEVGLRPGEKLYEELLIRAEELDKTENDMIFIERDTPPSRQEMDETINSLRKAAVAWDNGEGQSARQVLKQIVPSFCDPEALNRNAEAAREMQAVR